MANILNKVALACVLAACIWVPPSPATLAGDSSTDRAVSSAADSQPRLRTTVLGTKFEVRLAFDPVIEKTINSTRQEVQAARSSGRLIGYISTPLSARGGGYRPINVELSAFVKRRLEARYGVQRFYALDPARVNLPNLDDLVPAGGEYMYMWTQILAGEDGSGKDFDMVWFVGPTDVRAFFGVGDGAILDALNRYVDDRSQSDADFRAEMARPGDRREQFLRYYGLRASVAFSDGGHDEWNLFRTINQKRPLSEQLSLFFDSRPLSPAEMEQPVRPGYEKK